MARVDPSPSATLRFSDARMSFHRIVEMAPVALPPMFAVHRRAPRLNRKNGAAA